MVQGVQFSVVVTEGRPDSTGLTKVTKYMLASELS